jgi:hypothetical protein
MLITRRHFAPVLLALSVALSVSTTAAAASGARLTPQGAAAALLLGGLLLPAACLIEASRESLRDN